MAWSIEGSGSTEPPPAHIFSFQLSQGRAPASRISASPAARLSAQHVARIAVTALARGAS
ncbi:hypothetical protein [Bradyrhizobium sp. CCBAU 53421]|uniref:hypothetical protein n=1 Tax=Bradyrhizobium sp. CCBAU 53421 TaxID=1325120 RepID=UPI00188B8212|nr:hypothetical protein XH92_25265 [Bradyrhizobium sp. CCBAU 53421]